MFDGLRRYIWDRRRGIVKIAGVVGGVYYVSKYVLERIEEMREKAARDRAARENLKRRFLQNQQDCTFTILALLPTLGTRILEEMDVEAVTEALQGQSRLRVTQASRDTSISSARSGRISPDTMQTAMPASLVQSAIRVEHEHPHSSGASINGEDGAAHGQLGESSLSWVEQFTSSSASNGNGSPTSSAGPLLSDSNISGSVSNASDLEARSENGSFRSSRYRDKSKAELWKEVKILTFTRTLTIIYATSLLSILTHIQLNLTGRTKYIYSVLQMELRERMEEEFSIGSLFWSGLTDSIFRPSQEEKNEQLKRSELTEDTERKYLLLSWWISHVSWQQLAEKIRRCVEERLASISLKATLNANEVTSLLQDIRLALVDRITPESPPRYCDILLPPEPDLIDQVLSSNGVLKENLPSSSPDQLFELLVDDTRRFILTPDFDLVLNATLDKSFTVLQDYLNVNIFTTHTEGSGSEATAAAVTGATHRLADVLPVMARWSHTAIYGLPNEVVEGLATVEELTGFSAYIYSSYSGQFE